MRIAYVGFLDPYIDNGILIKVKSQIEQWRAQGNIAQLFCIIGEKQQRKYIDDAIVCSSFSGRYTGSTLSRLVHKNLSCLQLKKVLQDFKPDIIYYRFDPYQPMLIRTFKAIAPYVVEFNTNDLTEFKISGKLRYWYNRLTRDIVIKNAAGFVSVSREVSDILKDYNKPCVVIGNGYDLNKVPDIERKKSAQVNLVFVGTNNYSWHGLDKIIYLARKMPEFVFHIIGSSSGDLGPDLPANLIAHGFNNLEYIRNIYKQCDIAIGTLALHRKEMNETSPLKVREYLAHGLPVIIGYEDTDLSGEYEFILNIGNTEDNVSKNLDNIRNFVTQVRGKAVDRITANLLIGSSQKEERRVEFFRSVITFKPL